MTPVYTHTGNAAIVIAELARVKALFQLRAITAIIAVPPHAIRSLPDHASDRIGNGEGEGRAVHHNEGNGA